ncbi:MAG: hypothetical protein DRP01_07025 [Archaeoglobales archaeon]|nr:MAG: hypothetical protein DRP01_07025 [Archaeoglobales archaeon]
MVQILGCGVNVEAPAGNVLESTLDEVKGVFATIIGTLRQILAYIWNVILSFVHWMAEDPWRFAHLTATAIIMFSP